MAIDITFGGLRAKAVHALETRGNADRTLIEIEYVNAMANIQVAQELNEIKHILAAANGLEEFEEKVEE